MKVERLRNETYRVRKQYKGKKYVVYFDHKPTQREAMMKMAAELSDTSPQNSHRGSFNDYLTKYINAKEKQRKPQISPSTIRGYLSIQRNISDYFKELPFSEITNEDIQEEINSYKLTRSAKTIKNMYGLIRSVFTEYRPELKLSIKLPSAEKKAEYEPTTDDIQRILEEVKGTRYSIPFQLAVLGLRRGEICALEISDLDSDDVLTINKDMVADKNNKLVIKPPKTNASNRRITIPHELAEEIRTQGYIYNGFPNSLNRYLHNVQDRLDIPHFRFHMLRHFCVAYLHSKKFTERQIMAWGGWATRSVMETAYNYNLNPSESQREISNKMSELF